VQKVLEVSPICAFPQLVDSKPEETVLPNRLKGWLEKVMQAIENKQRIGEREAQMERYGLIHPSPDPSCEIPKPGSWADESYERAELLWSNGAKHIQSRLPRGGWVHINRR
jgi:hypothetical protein